MRSFPWQLLRRFMLLRWTYTLNLWRVYTVFHATVLSFFWCTTVATETEPMTMESKLMNISSLYWYYYNTRKKQDVRGDILFDHSTTQLNATLSSGPIIVVAVWVSQCVVTFLRRCMSGYHVGYTTTMYLRSTYGVASTKKHKSAFSFSAVVSIVFECLPAEELKMLK